MNFTRRELGLLAPALAAAQEKQAPKPKPMLASNVYRFEDLPVKPRGAKQHGADLDAKSHTCYPIDLHHTARGPRLPPHPPHHHVHGDTGMRRSGQLAVPIQGLTTRATAGSVVSVN